MEDLYLLLLILIITGYIKMRYTENKEGIDFASL